MATVTKSYKKDGNTKVSPHFTYGEFRSYSSTYKKLFSDQIKLNLALPELLEKLIVYKNLSKIVIINGYRSPAHNKAVGGGKYSKHLYGDAVDIACFDSNGKKMSGKEVCCALEDLKCYGIGYMSSEHVHVDVRPKSQKWFGDETKRVNGKYKNIGASFYSYWGIKKGSFKTYKEDDEVIDTTKMIIDGREYTVKRINKDNTNFIELRSLEQAGYVIDFKNNKPVLEMPKGSVKFKHNGKEFSVDGINDNGTNKVIVRKLLEELGFKVGWDGETSTVIIE